MAERSTAKTGDVLAIRITRWSRKRPHPTAIVTAVVIHATPTRLKVEFCLEGLKESLGITGRGKNEKMFLRTGPEYPQRHPFGTSFTYHLIDSPKEP